MGNAESVVKNMDKRTVRREYAGHFKEAIGCWRDDTGEDRGMAVGAPVDPLSSDSAMRVCVRKRPIFPHETSKGEYDVISTPGVQGNSAGIVVHDARMKADMINMFMNHNSFSFDSVFGDVCSNEEVYMATTQPLIEAVATEGLHATVMMYGQTGSGKTYTMNGIQKLAFDDLFQATAGAPVTLSFVELIGECCNDMLNRGASAKLVSAPDGSAYAYPCVEVEVASPEDLGALIAHANKLRATAATGVHDTSSRSHALCRITCASGGQLMLVDLAGSEHRIDSDEHNAERRKEGALINASLSALKDCVRARAAGRFVAYRNNRLTQLLRGCFAEAQPGRPRPCTVLIATVSPSSKDTEHSLNTLRHACIMDGQGDGAIAGSSHVSGGSVAREDLGSIDVCQIAKDRHVKKKAEAAKRKASGLGPETGAPKPRAAPAHQSKESNVVSRDKLDARGMRQLPAHLRDDLLAARDPVHLREVAQRRVHAIGLQRLAALVADTPADAVPRTAPRDRTPPSPKQPARRSRWHTEDEPPMDRPSDAVEPRVESRVEPRVESRVEPRVESRAEMKRPSRAKPRWDPGIVDTPSDSDWGRPSEDERPVARAAARFHEAPPQRYTD
eukprot:Hpha_TRINITY_DN14602_c0_g4::TRINITY_DN14602_c0_g4_i1::g.47970::m.47970/K10393/KIF2_24, MCAK; kinesin family member 2/24